MCLALARRTARHSGKASLSYWPPEGLKIVMCSMWMSEQPMGTSVNIGALRSAPRPGYSHAHVGDDSSYLEKANVRRA